MTFLCKSKWTWSTLMSPRCAMSKLQAGLQRCRDSETRDKLETYSQGWRYFCKCPPHVQILILRIVELSRELNWFLKNFNWILSYR